MKKRVSSLLSKTAASLKLLLVVSLLASLFVQPIGLVSALSKEQKMIFDKGIRYYDHEIVDAAGDSAAAGGTIGPLVGCSAGEEIWNSLLGKNVQGTALTPQHVAGIMGNMQAESGFNPRRVQSTSTPSGDRDTPPAGSRGYGIVQWTPGTKIMADFERLRDTTLKDLEPPVTIPGDMRFQLQLLLDQLNGASAIQESAAGRDLVAQTTTEGALRSFMLRYERPRDQSNEAVEKREPFATTAFNSGTSGQWCPPSSGGGGGGSSLRV